MGIPDLQPDRHYTYGDYLTWPENERWELFEGRPVDMTPAPLIRHQRISGELFGQLRDYFRGKSCELFHTQTDVLLPERDVKEIEIDTVLQPDMFVVCDPAKVGKKNIRGAPDLVIEILSESTVSRDQGEKLILYEKHGVRCYLIADPWGNTLTVRYQESPGKFGRPELFTAADKVPIRIFDGLTLDLARVFAQK